MCQANLERKRETLYKLDYVNKLLHYYYPNVRQQTYQINEKPFCTALTQLPEVSVMLYEPYP